jgi:hypothetical protein
MRALSLLLLLLAMACAMLPSVRAGGSCEDNNSCRCYFEYGT